MPAAARVNDQLAEVIAAHPARFSGFAALPLQDGDAAARELHRAVTQLGLRGALVNAHSQLGADHILFGADYPFEDMATATAFLAEAPISEADRTKISHGNAERLLRLPQA